LTRGEPSAFFSPALEEIEAIACANIDEIIAGIEEEDASSMLLPIAQEQLNEFIYSDEKAHFLRELRIHRPVQARQQRLPFGQ